MGAPLIVPGRYGEGDRRWWVSISKKGRRRGGEPVGYPPPMGGGEVSRRRRQPTGAHGSGAGKSWRKGMRLGWARWARMPLRAGPVRKNSREN
jgi:hypothetical protein